MTNLTRTLRVFQWLPGSDKVCHVYPGHVYLGFQGTHDVQYTVKGYTVAGNQGTYDKLDQNFRGVSMTSRIWLSLSCVPWFPGYTLLYILYLAVLKANESLKYQTITKKGKINHLLLIAVASHPCKPFDVPTRALPTKTLPTKCWFIL